MAGSWTLIAIAVADTVPRLVPTIHTGRLLFCFTNSSTLAASVICLGSVRSVQPSSSMSLGRPKIATLKPLDKKYGAERTRKLPPVALPSSNLPKPPPPPGNKNTVALASGAASQTSVVTTPSRVGTLNSVPSAWVVRLTSASIPAMIRLCMASSVCSNYFRASHDDKPVRPLLVELCFVKAERCALDLAAGRLNVQTNPAATNAFEVGT